ncbi:MAG: glycosyltransferase family 4 protein [Planctomycetes bacterium]|nr:glycosyltransferase family 4 protein [Planctomycetota bacterium]
MRIAIDALSLRRPHTGVQRALAGLLRGLASLVRNGDRAVSSDDSFIVVAGRGADLPELPDRFKVLRTFFRPENRTLRVMYQHFRLNRRVFSAGGNLLHAPAYTAPRFGFLPFVLTIHDVFVYDYPSLCHRTNVAHFKRFMPASVRNAARIIVPSRYTADRLKAEFPDAARKTVVVPFGVDDVFSRERVPSWPAEAYALPKSFILYVGALDPKKNIDTLIKAFFAVALAKKLHTDLVLAGPDAGDGKRLRRVAEGIGFGGRVHFTGFVPDEFLPALYRKAQAFVLPSVAEGFGFPLLEAMTSGVPAVASGVASLRELAADTVRFYTPGNVADLRKALEDVLFNKKLAARLSAAAKKRAAEFSWERTARETMAVYREALA